MEGHHVQESLSKDKHVFPRKYVPLAMAVEKGSAVLQASV